MLMDFDDPRVVPGFMAWHDDAAARITVRRFKAPGGQGHRPMAVRPAALACDRRPRPAGEGRLDRARRVGIASRGLGANAASTHSCHRLIVTCTTSAPSRRGGAGVVCHVTHLTGARGAAPTQGNLASTRLREA